MKKYLVFIVLLLSLFKMSHAHQSDFTEHCDAISLPYLGSSHTWNAVTSTDSALYLVGNSGVCFIYTYKGGIKTVNTGAGANLTGVQFLNSFIGFTWGTNGILLKTNDGGNAWTAIVTNTSNTIDKIQFIDENNAYMMVAGAISKTTNGGASWAPLTLPAGVSFTDFYFFDVQNGQMCGKKTTPTLSGYLYTTTDAGSSWNQLYTDTCAFTKLNYVNGSKGYLYGETSNDPLLFETNNTGGNWAIKYSNASWSLASDVVLYNNQTTFISNETTGSYVYGSPYFLDPTTGIVLNPINIYTSHVNNEEMLYVITEAGLFRYVSGESICKQLNFANGISANATNPYNSLAPGKKVRFKALFYNVTNNTVVKAQGTVKCSSPYITITDNLATYNNTLNHQSSWSADEYEMELSAAIPDNYVIHLEFEFLNQNPAGNPQKSIFDLPIINNPFIMPSITVIDTTTQNTSGNGNGIIEPNETAQLTPYIKSQTRNYFYNMQGYLFSKFSQCAIWTNVSLPDGSGIVYNNYMYSTIDPNQTVRTPGVFVFTDSFKTNYNIPLTLVLRGQLSGYRDDNNYDYRNYTNVLYNFGIDFIINSGYSLPPDSLLSDTTFAVDSTLRIGLTNRRLTFTLFPNPNEGEFYLKTISETALENTVIEIHNLLGKCVYTQLVQREPVVKINISTQPSGLYFLTVTSLPSTETIKFIKR